MSNLLLYSLQKSAFYNDGSVIINFAIPIVDSSSRVRAYLHYSTGGIEHPQARKEFLIRTPLKKLTSRKSIHILSKLLNVKSQLAISIPTVQVVIPANFEYTTAIDMFSRIQSQYLPLNVLIDAELLKRFLNYINCCLVNLRLGENVDAFSRDVGLRGAMEVCELVLNGKFKIQELNE